MCTIVLARNVIKNFPLIIAANRDEQFARPSESPAERAGGMGGKFFAPRDLQRGGTWIGINEHGVFSGLTNRKGVISKPGKVSRGDLPVIALGCKSAEEAATKISSLTGTDFNGFYLLIADKEKCFLIGGDGIDILSRPVLSQFIAVTNQGAGEAHLPETPRRVNSIIKLWESKIRSSLPARDGSDEFILKSFAEMLHIHDEDQHGTCINEENYGTKSSSIMYLNDKKWNYFYRERKNGRHICEQCFEPLIIDL